MLFIVQHQTSELWMKLMLHELRAAVGCVASDQLQPAFKMLARVSKIMEQLVHAWDVLATMTPPEYSALRPYLARSSGFQSYQYRQIEFLLGNKNAAMLKPHAHRGPAGPGAPGLRDALAVRRVAAPAGPSRAGRAGRVLQRDWTQPYQASAGVEQAWLTVYRDTDRYWDLYQLGEKLTDLEDAFRLWRFRHVTTVERVIGFKRGTGARRAWTTCARCWKWCCSPRSGSCARTSGRRSARLESVLNRAPDRARAAFELARAGNHMLECGVTFRIRG